MLLGKNKVTWMGRQKLHCLQMQLSSQTLPSRCSAFLLCSVQVTARTLGHSCAKGTPEAALLQVITPWDVKGGADGRIDYNKLRRDVRPDTVQLYP